MLPDFSAPRISGHALGALRAVTSTAPGAALILRKMRADYLLDRMTGRDASHRGPLRTHPFPSPARKPATWTDARLDPPTPPEWRTTHARLRAAFTAGNIDPERLLERVVEQIHAGRFGHAAHSPYIALDTDRAREASRQSAARLKAGKPLSPIDGLLIPIKDELDMAGLPTRGGTRYLETPATADAFIVSLLRNAGAILLGKTHATEWGMNPIGTNPHQPFPHNPRHPDRAAGGSSTGSAVAVALGHAAVAFGSDGGGSIRIPSTLCGLYGLKPTYARLGTTGNIFGGGSVAVGGPIAQSTSDLVDLLEAMTAERDPDDFLNSKAPKPPGGARSWRRALGRGVQGLRIGVPEHEWTDAEPSVQSACRDALRALAEDGAELVPLSMPALADAPAIGVLSIAPETVANLADDYRHHADLFGDDLAIVMHLIGALGADQYLCAQRARTHLRDQTARALQDVHVIALPALPIVAPPYLRGEEATAISDDHHTRAMCRYNFFANLTGLPAGTAPVGTVDGLPIGLQIIGDAWDEAAVIATLAHLERLDLATGLAAPPDTLDPTA